MAVRSVDKEHEDDNENGERDDLKGQTCKKDVVGIGGILAVGISDTNHGSTHNLYDCRDNVTNYKDPEDELRAQGCILAANAVDGYADEGVDCSLLRISLFFGPVSLIVDSISQ